MIKIIRIIENYDMRKIHKLRKREMKKLKAGTCSVAFNKSRNIARIIDHFGGIHTFYADLGEVFDMETLRDWVYDAFYIELNVGQTVRKKASELKRAA